MSTCGVVSVGERPDRCLTNGQGLAPVQSVGVSVHWVGIDCGYSHLGVAMLAEDGRVLDVRSTREPAGDGHNRAVALARVHALLPRLPGTGPVRLAGYCYEHSGVAEAFATAGWDVAGSKGLNDVVGVYGLTDMCGHAVVAGCGTYSQVVYVDGRHAVRWCGDDVAAELPDWPLHGGAYAGFVARRQGRSEPSPTDWAGLGPLLSASLDDPATQAFLAEAAAKVVRTRDILWRHSGHPRPPAIFLGGGAVSDDRLWEHLSRRWQARGVTVHRAPGAPSVGLARYAMAHPEADPWAVLGSRRPAWLS